MEAQNPVGMLARDAFADHKWTEDTVESLEYRLALYGCDRTYLNAMKMAANLYRTQKDKSRQRVRQVS